MAYLSSHSANECPGLSSYLDCQSRIRKQFEALLEAKSLATRKQVAIYLQQLSLLEKGSAWEQLTAWYYINFCTGYGYLVKADGEVKTRPGLLSPNQVMDHLGGVGGYPYYFGIKPSGPLTSWAAIDVDMDSRYHPASLEGEGIEPVLEAMKKIGLEAVIEFQSSYSNGIHLWFPLREACGTWDLAKAMEATCRSSGLEIRDGVLELRPNTKNYGSSYKGIRAPLSGDGNAIWVENVDLVDELGALKLFWLDKAPHNCLRWSDELAKDLEVTTSSNRRGQKGKTTCLEAIKERLAAGFTGLGQTQEVKLAALQFARLIEGIDNICKLEARVYELIRQAPGYGQYCGHQAAIDKGKYLAKGELKKALALKPGGYAGTWKERSNDLRSTDANKRASDCLEEAISNGLIFGYENEAILYLKAKGAPCRSWWKKDENSEILRKLRQNLLLRPFRVVQDG